MLRIKKGDNVTVLTGKDKGKLGAVEKIFAKENLIQVAGINIFKKHQKAFPGKRGGIIELSKPLPLSLK